MPRVGSNRQFACWIGALIMMTAAGATTQSPSDRDAGSKVVGHVVPSREAMPFVGIPPADQQAVRATAERLWSIVLRNPAVNPPIGFNLKPSLIGHKYAAVPGVPRDAPYTCSASGYLYWYVFQPGINRVEVLPVAMQAFFVHANRLSVVFSGSQQWHTDAAGEMYWEPREVRRIAGHPQYSNGIIAVTNESKPLWKPVPRERLLRWELDARRAALRSAIDVARDSESYDPQAILDAWLADRPKRQRASDELYELLKKRDPALAEKNRATSVKVEQDTEQTLRGNISRQAQQRPFLERQGEGSRQRSETCVRYLEDELKRLSPAELAAPGYVAIAGGKRAPSSACSAVVDAGFPGAQRIVEQNWAYFDRGLPPTAVQAILIDFGNFESGASDRTNWKNRVYERLRDGLDYEALSAMLAKR